MKNKDNTNSNSWYRDIEYKMPKLMASELLKTRKGLEQNMPPQKFLCMVVNEQFGIKGNCVRVVVE